MRYACKADIHREVTAYRIVSAELSRVPGTKGYDCRIDNGDIGNPGRQFISEAAATHVGAHLSECYFVQENGNDRVVHALIFEEEWLPLAGVTAGAGQNVHASPIMAGTLDEEESDPVGDEGEVA